MTQGKFVIINDDQAYNRSHIEGVYRPCSTNPHPQGAWMLRILVNGRWEDLRFQTKEHRDSIWNAIVGNE